MMRPQPRFFMPGTAARMLWNAEDRLMAIMASHFSIGNSSIGDTNWMPALLTRMSTAPKVLSPSLTISATSAGLVMSAGECTALTLNSLSMLARSFSMSAGAPMPLSTILAPSAAKARAIASPMPLVDPVTTAVLPVKVPIFQLLFLLHPRQRLVVVGRQFVDHHGLAVPRRGDVIAAANQALDIALARAAMFVDDDGRKIVVARGDLG